MNRAIIRFSNDLCYSDTPLIPLRQYGLDRLTPLEHFFVDGGYREGKGQRVVNPPEAKAIVDKIVELCNDKRYTGKTIGVIVLQGNSQGNLIEGQLLKQLGAEEIASRRLVCGSPYNFQGDERDIIFISMITAPDEDGHIKEGPTDEKRFNVAMSRGRDQVWLFHSVRSDDLSNAYLRKRLLQFFENKRPQKIAGIERDDLERRALQDNRVNMKPPDPFDSWFEVDVALELLRKDFNVIPQYKVAGRKIDLVIEGGQSRLAVECDGEFWHSLDDYEKDMLRQRQLERCGWEFFRIRESAFYLDKDNALAPLWPMLKERGIFPENFVAEKEYRPNDKPDIDLVEVAKESSNKQHKVAHNHGHLRSLFDNQPQDVPSDAISNAIISALRKCPNHSCTIKSLTSRVLKEMGVNTRGNPRLEYQRKIMRKLSKLERRNVVKKYKAKNERVKLIS